MWAALLKNAFVVFPVYFSSNVNELLLATDATFLTSLSGPKTKRSPTLISELNALAEIPAPFASVVTPVTDLDPFACRHRNARQPVA